MELRTIGWYLFEDDEILAAQYNSMEKTVHVTKKRRLDDNQSLVTSGSPTADARALAQFLDEDEGNTSQNYQPSKHSRPMSGLTQRILAYLFKRAQQDGSQK